MSSDLDDLIVLDLHKTEMGMNLDSEEWLPNSFDDCLIECDVNSETRPNDASNLSSEKTCGMYPFRRPSMTWNTRYHQKEEKKKVLRISQNKLRSIDDPELFLRRAVLINNTFRRLQQEFREEKSPQKSKSNWRKLASHRALRFAAEYESGFEDKENGSPEKSRLSGSHDGSRTLSNVGVPPVLEIVQPIDVNDDEASAAKRAKLEDGDSLTVNGPDSGCDKSTLAKVIDQVFLPYRPASAPGNYLADSKFCNCCHAVSGVGLHSVVLHSLIVSLES